MSAHASQAFSIAHCTDSEDLPLGVLGSAVSSPSGSVAEHFWHILSLANASGDNDFDSYFASLYIHLKMTTFVFVLSNLSLTAIKFKAICLQHIITV